MSLLGTVPFRSLPGVKEARRKLLLVVSTLVGDELLAGRLAGALSQACRQVVAARGEGSFTLSFADLYGQLALVLDLHGAGRPEAQLLQPFFDTVQAIEDGQRATVALGALRPPSAQGLEELRGILARQDREALMASLQASNQELQSSLENLRRTRSAKERMESELNIGREIQMSMLPLEFPQRDDCQLFAKLVPAREVGGDFYDFFFVDPSVLCVCVGDVSGKGVPSALFAAVTKTLIKSLAKSTPSPAAVLTQVNGELAEGNDSCMFVTVFLALLDLESGEFVYCNAGHNPPMIRRASGSVDILDQRHGPVVAAMDGLAYREDRGRLDPEDLLVLFTDGVTEALNPTEDLFSDPRLADHLRQASELDAISAVESTLAAVRTFEDGAEQADDITLLSVLYLGPQEGAETAHFEREIRNDLAEIGGLLDAFEAFADEHGVPLKFSRKFLIALDDLVNNVISYGYEDPDGEHTVRIRAQVVGDVVSVVLEDDGRPFNPLQQAKPDVESGLEEREIGGLGIHLVREILDDVHYERRGDRNVLTMRARLTDAPNQSSPANEEGQT
jgi:sigma-B regulation protein RsbU (phosphoserine phosphatase)